MRVFKEIYYKPSLFLVVLTTISFTSVSCLYQKAQNYHVVNQIQEFSDTILDSDYLSVFLFCSEKSDNCRALENIYDDIAFSVKDFAKIYAFDCDKIEGNDNEASNFPLCKVENVPYLSTYAPPETKINPYTRQPSLPIENAYQGTGDIKSIGNFIKQHMPAFRKTISSKDSLETFLKDELIPNKVILFTNKPQTSPLYKALASEFRDRLLVIYP